MTMIHFELSLFVCIRDAVTAKTIDNAQILVKPSVKHIKKNGGIYVFSNLFNTTINIEIMASNYNKKCIEVAIGDTAVYANVFLEPVNVDKHDMYISAKENKDDIELVKGYEIELIKAYSKKDLELAVVGFGAAGIARIEMAVLQGKKAIVFTPSDIQKVDDMYILSLDKALGVELSEMTRIYYVNRYA